MAALPAFPPRSTPSSASSFPSPARTSPSEVLDPRETWADKAAYDAQARKLAAMCRENVEAFSSDVSSEIREAGLTEAYLAKRTAAADAAITITATPPIPRATA